MQAVITFNDMRTLRSKTDAMNHTAVSVAESLRRRTRVGGTQLLKIAVCGCLFLIAGSTSLGAEPEVQPPDAAVICTFAKDFLKRIQTKDWLQAWKGAVVADAYYVVPSKGEVWRRQFKPVWYAKVEREGDSVGYLMWESTTPHRLLEFGIDADKPFVPDDKTCQGIQDVPNLQQFPLKGKTARQVASGCVPTAGANVLGYWVKHGFPGWQREKEVAGQQERGALEMLAKRLRDAMPVLEIEDAEGFTDTKMPLTGAYPADLAKAIVEDAKKRDVQVEVSENAFLRSLWEREIEAQRPILLTCEVLLPHKPRLSWMHEVTGIGWTVIDGDFFVIVHDNFYPTKRANAARWLRAEGLGPITTVVPRKAR